VVPAMPPAHRLSEGFSHFPSWADKDEWTLQDYTRQCLGGGDIPAQEEWLAGAEQIPISSEMLSYMEGLYGVFDAQAITGLNVTGLANVNPNHMRYFWNNVPGRYDVNVTWSTVRCAVLGLIRPDALIAPIDDVQHSPKLITQPMIDRCSSRPECSDGGQCLDVPLRAIVSEDEARQSAVDLKLIVRNASSEMRTCLARGLESFGNFSAGADRGWAITYRDGQSAVNGLLPSASFQIDAELGYPALRYQFPGFFVHRSVGPPPMRPQGDPFPMAITETGVPDHTWVEVMRIGRVDDKDPIAEAADRSTIGQVWFWFAPGSGIWWNTGRTLVVSDSIVSPDLDGALSPRACTTLEMENSWWQTRDQAFVNVTCADAVRRGYDSMQLTSSFCGFSWELIDCRGHTRYDAQQTWSAACPPPHVRLMRGLPLPRLAPALEGTSGPASGCLCATNHDFVNCDANDDDAI